MSSPSLTIRPARTDDARALDRLAALDSARPLGGDVLLAELDGRPIAAVALADGTAVADPFVPSEGAVDVLRLRAGQLRSPVAAHRPLLRFRGLGTASG